WLQNQFGSVIGQVAGLKSHCNPVQKTVAGENPIPIHNNNDHLVCFGFKPNEPVAPALVNIENQFSPADAANNPIPVQLAVGALQPLCLPSFKSQTAANLPPGEPTDLDHYACYQVKYPKGSTVKFTPPASVLLDDQFSRLLAPAQSLTASVLIPQSLCLPT